MRPAPRTPASSDHTDAPRSGLVLHDLNLPRLDGRGDRLLRLGYLAPVNPQDWEASVSTASRTTTCRWPQAADAVESPAAYCLGGRGTDRNSSIHFMSANPPSCRIGNRSDLRRDPEAAMAVARTDRDAARQMLAWLTLSCSTLAEYETQRAYLFGAGIPAGFLLGAGELGRTDLR